MARADVYLLPRAVYTGTDEPLTIRDPIYPRKSEVHVGSVFSFHGHRQERVTHWVVEAIYTVATSESGRVVESYVANVRMMADILTLRCEETREVRRLRFSWLSVSAAWRLEA